MAHQFKKSRQQAIARLLSNLVMIKTTYACIQERAKNNPDQTLFRYRTAEGWKIITTAEGCILAAKLAGGLSSQGVKAGDRVAIISDNRWEWMLLDLALQHLNAIIVGLYPTDSAISWQEILRDCTPSAIFVSGQLLRSVDTAIKELSIPVKICLDTIPENATHAKWLDLSLLTSAQPVPAASPDPDDLYTIIYTSGTTGMSKGAMLTYRNVASNADGAHERFVINANDHYLSFLPISHSFERTIIHTVLRGSACLNFGRGLLHLTDDLKEAKPTLLCAVPRVTEKVHARITEKANKAGVVARKLFALGLKLGRARFLLEQENKKVPFWLQAATDITRKVVFGKIHEIFGGRLHFIVSGGAALTPSVAEFFFSVGIPCFEGYGITECSPVVSANYPGNNRIGSVGPAFPGIKVKLGEDRELLVKGDNVMKGYWNNPEATAEAIDKDGWFHTGDIGMIDANDRLSITGRKKEILVTSGGKNISPVRIESIVTQSQYIAQCCVCADGRQSVSALIVPDFSLATKALAEQGEKPVSRTELAASKTLRAWIQADIKKANKQLAHYECIRNFIILDEEFTIENQLLTPTLKMKRSRIEARYRELLPKPSTHHTPL